MTSTSDLKAIVKVVEGCNLRCRYCYAGNFQELPVRVMSLTVLEKLTKEILESGAKRVEFCWHGGEPLLAGQEFYEHALEFQHNYSQQGQTVVNAMQSNGTLLTDKWFEFLESNDMGVGISIDGPAHIHDAQRPFADGSGSSTEVLQAIRRWQEQAQGVPILCVVTKDSVRQPELLFDSLLEFGIKSMDFLPCSKISSATGSMFKDGVSPQEYGEFMTRVFDRWWNNNDPSIRIRFFENILQGLLGGRPSLCKFTRSCSKFFTFDVDGTVYPCDDFLGIADFSYGNILEVDLEDILLSERRQDFISLVEDVAPKCRDCSWFSLCNGGCSFYRYMSRGRFTDVNYYCAARRRIFEHVKHAVEQLIPWPIPMVENSAPAYTG